MPSPLAAKEALRDDTKECAGHSSGARAKYLEVIIAVAIFLRVRRCSHKIAMGARARSRSRNKRRERAPQRMRHPFKATAIACLCARRRLGQAKANSSVQQHRLC